MTQQLSSGVNDLMQLTMSECQELKELLLTESQKLTLSPIPLLDAFESIQSSTSHSQSGDPNS